MDQSDYVILLIHMPYSQLTIDLTNERVHFLMTLKYMIVGEKFLIC